MAGSESAQDSAQTKQSLAFSCLDKSFLSVDALTLERDSFPAVQLTLTDPQGRTAGGDSTGEPIPDSSYGKIVQLPKYPQRSKALAIEVCNAEQGVYELNVRELGNASYIIIASASGNTDNGSSAILNHVGRKGRIRQYKFKFTIKGRQLNLNWLDGQGHEQLLIEPPEW